MCMIYLVLTVLFLHISIMRIVIRFETVLDSDDKYVLITIKLFFIPILRLSPNYKKLVDKITGEKDIIEKSAKEKIGKRKITSFFIRAALALLKRIDVRYLGLISDFGTGDAASTAVVYGTIKSVFDGICAVLECSGYSRVTPDYENMHIFVDFGGIISLSIADIIIAVISALFNNKKAASEKPIFAGAA